MLSPPSLPLHRWSTHLPDFYCPGGGTAREQAGPSSAWRGIVGQEHEAGYPTEACFHHDNPWQLCALPSPTSMELPQFSAPGTWSCGEWRKMFLRSAPLHAPTALNPSRAVLQLLPHATALSHIHNPWIGGGGTMGQVQREVIAPIKMPGQRRTGSTWRKWGQAVWDNFN